MTPFERELPVLHGFDGFDILMIAVFIVIIWSLWEGIKAHGIEKHGDIEERKPESQEKVEKIREGLRKKEEAA